jgi:hypothetical protein
MPPPTTVLSSSSGQACAGVAGKLLEELVLEPRVVACRVRFEPCLVVPVPAGG